MMVWDDSQVAYMDSWDVFSGKGANNTMFCNLCFKVVIHYFGVLESSQEILSSWAKLKYLRWIIEANFEAMQ